MLLMHIIRKSISLPRRIEGMKREIRIEK